MRGQILVLAGVKTFTPLPSVPGLTAFIAISFFSAAPYLPLLLLCHRPKTDFRPESFLRFPWSLSRGRLLRACFPLANNPWPRIRQNAFALSNSCLNPRPLHWSCSPSWPSAASPLFSALPLVLLLPLLLPFSFLPANALRAPACKARLLRTPGNASLPPTVQHVVSRFAFLLRPTALPSIASALSLLRLFFSASAKVKEKSMVRRAFASKIGRVGTNRSASIYPAF